MRTESVRTRRPRVRWVAYLCAVVNLAFFSVGCRPPAKAEDDQSQLAIDEGKLYETYLSANRKDARTLLLQLIQLGESRNKYQPGLASELYLDYCRLYLLDRRVGDEALAKADIIKAQYWFLRHEELDGVPENAAATKLMAASAEDLCKAVDILDKNATHGRGPRYLESISAQTQPLLR